MADGRRGPKGTGMFTRILVPLDGTDEAAAALPVATELARRLGSALLLLAMVPTADARLGLATDVASGALTDPAVYGAEVRARSQAAEGYVAAVAQQLADEGLSASYAIGTGDPGDGIVAAAREQGVDLILMATHGRSGLARLLFGSTTDDVLRHAGIPVLAVPVEGVDKDE